MEEIIFLEGTFKENVWGGNKLASVFNYKTHYSVTGEYWAIGAHPNGDSKVISGEFKGKTLSFLWKNHKELFKDYSNDSFPLLVKIIDAKDDLSVQVHPDDIYAKINENNSLGKSECWYVLDCAKDATIIIGHTATNKQELKDMIDEKKWKQLLREVPIKKGDFFQIDPGTIHAIKGGTMVLEIQQNSDITYRLYDYNRKQNGKLRNLHINKSLDVIINPYITPTTNFKTETNSNYIEKILIDCKYYKIRYINTKLEAKFFKTSSYELLSVISGEGYINKTFIKKGDHFIISANLKEYVLSKNLEIIVSTAGEY